MAKKKTTRKKKSKKAAQKEMLLVASKVREYVKEQEGLTSGELLEALNECVYCCLDRAIERAKANNRSTVKAQDV